MQYTEVVFSFTPQQPTSDILVAQLAEIGFESFVEQEKGMTAYIPSDQFSVMELETIHPLQQKNNNIAFVVNEIAEQNWNEMWESNFDPIEIGKRCHVRAPFHTAIEGVEHDIVISPKMSFGTGHHETTYQLLERLLELDVENKRVLDMGCGTAVLAVLAEMRGAKEVLAIDNDEWAYNNAKENLSLNSVQNIDVKLGDASLLEDATFHVILANINKNVLLADLSVYAKALEPGGSLLLSGFFETDCDDLTAAAKAQGLHSFHRTAKNKWATLMCKK